MQPLHFTEAALAEIRKVMDSGKVPEGYRLRAGIRGAAGVACGMGSAGFDGYILGFDEQKDTDDVFTIHGIEVLVDKKHAMHVLGMEIDYIRSEEQEGFVFNNPRMKE